MNYKNFKNLFNKKKYRLTIKIKFYKFMLKINNKFKLNLK